VNGPLFGPFRLRSAALRAEQRWLEAHWPIEQAEAVKTSLRETLTNTSELITFLKKHRKQTKLVRSTLASLRQLQSIDA